MKTLINIKTDKEVKEGAQALAQELGLPLSVVVNAYLKDFIRNRGITISERLDEDRDSQPRFPGYQRVKQQLLRRRIHRIQRRH